MFVGILLLTLLQTASALGCFLLFANGSYVFAVILLAIMVLASFFVGRIREEESPWISIVPGSIFAITAFPRFLIGLIASGIKHEKMAIELLDESGLQHWIGRLFYIEIDEDDEISPLKNFLVITLILLPLGLASSFLTLVLGNIIQTDEYFLGGVFVQLILLLVVNVLIMTFREIKVATSYFNPYYTFKDRRTGRSKSFKANKGDYYYSNSSDVVRTSGGTVVTITLEAVFQILLCPFMGALYVVAWIFALLNLIGVRRVVSCYGNINIAGLRCKFIQKILHFLFTIVIDF